MYFITTWANSNTLITIHLHLPVKLETLKDLKFLSYLQTNKLAYIYIKQDLWIRDKDHLLLTPEAVVRVMP